jgi:CheY-like chemotaxis protein
MKILVIEDNAVTADTLCELLRLRGHQAEWAATGCSAFVRLSLFVPDVIVLDLLLPGCDGGQFLRRLSGHPVWGRIPVVVMTALADEDLRTWRVQLEPYGVRIVRKPFEVEELEEVLHEAAPA